ncbi:MAG: GNAT family N-acetyltransferase [Sphingomonadales bacterium]|nr:MAG: GNAT family N-acetyltransferase [Sphingomonadales bacterium]TNF06136.1 MAG: GNAT family N-acetyltransferase [Sphingomonadales bacterium]
MPKLLPLSSQSDAAIEALLDAAFGPDRHGRTAYAIRSGMRWLPRFSYAILRGDGEFAGLLQSWPVALIDEDKGTEIPLIMVGPVAVMPQWQQGGYGRMMMDRLVADADDMADAPLMMIGDPEYYGRFWGFSAESTGGWKAPGPVEMRRLLMRGVKQAPALPASSAGMLGPRQLHPAETGRPA